MGVSLKMNITFNHSVKQLAVFLLFISISLIFGCAPKPNPLIAQDITPSGIEVSNPHNASVSLDVEGGYSTQCLNYCVTTEAFSGALKTSMTSAGVFSNIVGPDEADFSLDVLIAKSLKHTMFTQWELRNAQTNAIVWSELIKTSVDPDSDLDDKERNEKLASQNIKQAIDKMRNLSL